MRKTIEKTTKQIVTLCDLCEKDCSNNFSNKCWLCQRECCFKCSKLLFAGHSGDLIEFPMHVCKKCLEHEAFPKAIQAVLDDTNCKLRMVTDEWKKLVKS